MSKDEIVTALRCCAEGECHGCTIHNDKQRCQERVLDAAADLIENQQREIDALRQANEGLLVHGRWTGVYLVEMESSGHEFIMTPNGLRCSSCRNCFKKELLWKNNYCPNCGAKMDL